MRHHWTDADFALVRRLASGEAKDIEDVRAKLSAEWGEPVSRAQVDSVLSRFDPPLSAEDVRAAHYRQASAPKVDEPAPVVKEAPPVDWTGARPASTGVGLERRLLLGDLHIPFHNLRACAGALALARALQPHRIIQLGDYYNMGAVSHHPRPFGGRENHSRALMQGRAFLDALRRAAPGAQITILIGNHDRWSDEYEDEHPELAGLFGPDWAGVTVVPRSRQPYVLGPVAYLHGYGGGDASAKKYALEVGPQVGVRHVKAAHHHCVQTYHARNGVEAWIVGWLGEPSHSAFDYAKNRDHWEQAVCVEDIIGDHVTTTPVRIVNGAALYGGRLVAA